MSPRPLQPAEGVRYFHGARRAAELASDAALARTATVYREALKRTAALPLAGDAAVAGADGLALWLEEAEALAAPGAVTLVVPGGAGPPLCIPARCAGIDGGALLLALADGAESPAAGTPATAALVWPGLGRTARVSGRLELAGDALRLPADEIALLRGGA